MPWTPLIGAIAQVSDNRASIGTLQNRLDSAAPNLSVTRENIAAAKSAIGDLDFASEVSDFKRSQILQQAGVQVYHAPAK